ncbi:hypothetical protein GIB67_005243 [Kingdonia uniflora]|uniref:Cyclic nucleotide-binding domain-containing protein n=1 Tax=Kingdonia uniflora TaxID=39325 RepID=A0A7J7NN29_9MAGN|nr:hypothetical protein GIB67_005243 [Kingdonia uniflora]
MAGVQAAYWSMLEEGRISQTIANILMQSVDEATDFVPNEPLCDWKGLKAHVHFPNYYRFLQTSFCPPKLVTYFTAERLESACYICAAFLRAHRIARRQLHDFIGDSEIAFLVINESEAEGEEARIFLEDVRETFPQVLRVVKTRQVTYSVLNHLSEYVQNLEKVGLLEQKEMVHLHDAVQTDLKKLLRNPPLVKMPKISELLKAHPLAGALPSVVHEPLEGSTKEVTKLRGVAIYREGSKPNGIWLLSNGVVKWASRSLRNSHSLHPKFSHGSTLGLYEVLIGKPYICDMIADSVVHCLFVDTEKILSALRSDPTVEGFLWQESAIVVAKLLLPQVYEKMAMQELRTLVVERSVMNIYIRGETIEIPHHSIGFLLEGFVKTQEELITSPGVLLSSYGDLSFLSVETSGATAASFCHQGSVFQVETRARVIFFDMAAFEANGVLQRTSSSWVSHSVDLPRGQSREHSGLMSWPEIFQMPMHTKGTDQKANSLSAKAMRLSIYGSMVSNTRSFPRNSKPEPSHSLSYPIVPSRRTRVRPLVSVQSEGAATRSKSLGAKEFSASNFNAPVPSSSKIESRVHDDSSDESGEEIIVRIDSPSSLSFREAS